ncbi:peptidoglycan-binding protein [Achromobacter aegrifaciens]|uniref:peptidoglycan-binding protein n=1 Tax=Achromobacter aegrifaciens TaxID=1287736 RepID=UPI0028A7D2CE|nr:peptidoglycan-binding protein [Achromobacter aegrifaciens]
MATGTLSVRDSGPQVLRLQKALSERGFSPGVNDGEFGQGTAAAVLAFQRSENLLADGVAGPRTLAALGLTTNPKLRDASGDVSVQVVSQMFPQTPLANIRTNLPVVLGALIEHDLRDKPMILMALATIRAESESFRPIREGISRFNTSPRGHDFDLYDNRRDLGNRGAPDGASFCGRGFVQLTGRANYNAYGPRLSPKESLIDNPERANDAKVAAKLLALFIGDRELPIKDALLHGNFQTARRLVNGGVHGLDRFMDAYRRGDALLPN